jgi:acetoin utilization deacetylase AcuC-like enzyme
MLTVISHPDCLLHDPGIIHPDIPDRLYAINNQLIMSGLDYVVRHRDAPVATRAQLERVHTSEHVTHILDLADTEKPVVIDGDTIVGGGSVAAAIRAAGAGVLGVDLVMSGEAGQAFCAIRPPGHHAERGAAMGFCLFNNIAVAAAHALSEHGLDRVAILDFDVHHGNGTENIFRNDPRVLFCSSFQYPLYPFTGHESDTTNLVDVPLPSGTDGAAFQAALTEHWFPALRAFRPELVLVSAGFDGHILDDISDFRLSEADYAWLTGEIMAVANEFADGRVISMLEGGYDAGATARSVVAHIKAMLP